MSDKSLTSLNKYQVNKTLRTKIKKSIPKPVLCPTYKILWPSVEPKLQESILSSLVKFFTENDFKLSYLDQVSLKGLNAQERKAKKAEHLQSLRESNNYKLRKCLEIGVNQVTRSLEKRINFKSTLNKKKEKKESDETSISSKYKKNFENHSEETSYDDGLSIIFVDRSSPWQMHRHLIQMAAICECPAVALDNLSERLSTLLSLTKFCTFAFKKCLNNQMIEQFVSSITPLCPKLEVPWLENEKLALNVNVGDSSKDNQYYQSADNTINEENDDDDVEMKSETTDVNTLSYEDLYVIKGINDNEYKELFALRKKSAFIDKNFELMMFNYNPHKPSFCPPPFSMASVFYNKKIDDRIAKKQQRKDGQKVENQQMTQQVKDFVSLKSENICLHENMENNRKRKFEDDVVKRVHKNEHKKKRKRK